MQVLTDAEGRAVDFHKKVIEFFININLKTAKYCASAGEMVETEADAVSRETRLLCLWRGVREEGRGSGLGC